MRGVACQAEASEVLSTTPSTPVSPSDSFESTSGHLDPGDKPGWIEARVDFWLEDCHLGQYESLFAGKAFREALGTQQGALRCMAWPYRSRTVPAARTY